MCLKSDLKLMETEYETIQEIMIRYCINSKKMEVVISWLYYTALSCLCKVHKSNFHIAAT